MKTYIYIHICAINNWKEIFGNIIKHIKTSNLYSKIDLIKCFILGDINLNEKPQELIDDKIKIIDLNKNNKLYERFTLNTLYEDSKLDNFNILYLHTKGVTRLNNKNVDDWVNYLLYFNLYKWDLIIKHLEKYDTIGVNLLLKPTIHYSGNFWWSKSSYIRKLNKHIHESYNGSEFWITSLFKESKYLSLWLSDINHYNNPYTSDKYHNKGVKMYSYENGNFYN